MAEPNTSPNPTKANNNNIGHTNLRTLLTTLVVYHHTAIPYGGSGNWPYTPPNQSHSSSTILTSFNAFNQTFFMATFFLLSGYYSAISIHKSSSTSIFAWRKVKRLGVPTLVYSVFGPGIVAGIMAGILDRGRDSDGGVWRDGWKGVMSWEGGIRGPVWYCGVLFTFDLVVVAGLGVVRWWKRRDGVVLGKSGETQEGGEETGDEGERECMIRLHDTSAVLTSSTKPTGERSLFVYLFMALLLPLMVSLVVNVWCKIDTLVPFYNFQAVYAPQYVAAYLVGVHAYSSSGSGSFELVINKSSGRRLEESKIFGRVSKILLGILSVVAIELLSGFVIAYGVDGIGRKNGDVETGNDGKYRGVRTGAIYLIWNHVTGMYFMVLLVRSAADGWLARKVWSIQSKGSLYWNVGRAAFGAFLVHVPVVVGLQCLAEGWIEDWRVLKTVIIGSVGTMLSFGVGEGLWRGLESLGVKGVV